MAWSLSQVHDEKQIALNLKYFCNSFAYKLKIIIGNDKIDDLKLEFRDSKSLCICGENSSVQSVL